MRHLAKVLMAVAALAVGLGQASGQKADDWVGQRVITRLGTVLKVGKRVVDRENLKTTASGLQRRDFRVYRVERVDGPRLWLVAEDEEVSGWVPAAQVVTLDRAIAHYTSEIRANPGSGSAYVNRGHIWSKKGEYDVAIADYTEAIRIDPEEWLGYVSRGNTWYLKKDYDRTIADYTEAIRIDPRYAARYDNRGLAWSLKGDFARAVADYAEAIRIDPGYAAAYTNRAWLWATCPDLKFRDGKRAVESATRACELTQWKLAYAIGTLAAAEAEAGDFAAAVKHEEKALGRYKVEADREGGRGRLALYRANKPFRDERQAR